MHFFETGKALLLDYLEIIGRKYTVMVVEKLVSPI
jgi:hypothetical protein